MSGGSMNYAYSTLLEISSIVHDQELSEMMKDLAKVLHDEEWWRSCDTSKETYIKSLNEFKKKWFVDNRENRLKGYIDEAIENMRDDLYSLIGMELEETKNES